MQTEAEIPGVIKELIGIPGPVFLEVRTRKGAREDLGRPTKSPSENKDSFMHTLISE